VLLAPPLFWSYGSANAMSAVLTHGATLVLQSRFEPGEALDLIEQHRCTALYTLPAITAALISHPEVPAGAHCSLRTGLTIGTPQDVGPRPKCWARARSATFMVRPRPMAIAA
jgi:fatty-acyl-CoA synthase